MAAHAPRLVGPFGASAVLHAGLGVAIFLLSTRPPIAMPPIYRVDIVGAPPAPKPAAGVVPSTPAQPTPQTKTPPPAAHPVPPPPDAVPVHKAPSRPAPAKATPTPPTVKTAPATTPQPTAASRTGGPGTDVANVHTEVIDFPYPGYLENIVRQVALNFQPDNPSADLRAEIAFLIKKDGTVIGVRFVTRSNDYSFDLEAQGAIEKAKAQFGPLPEGFPGDVLPVVFSFDPRLLH